MSRANLLSTIWSTIKEIDAGTIRQQVQSPFRLALLGSDKEAIYWLADVLRTNPYTQTLETRPQTLWAYPLPAKDEALAEAAGADVALVVAPVDQMDVSREQKVVAALRVARPTLPLIVVHILPRTSAQPPTADRRYWQVDADVVVDAGAAQAIEAELVPALLRLFPDRHVALAHHLPALRPAVATRLINESSFANASFAAGTGVAEMVPVLGIPLSLADIVVLTKNQVLLSYKLALALGHNGTARELVGPVAGVVGGSFVWRQIARTLVGFIPGFGLAPKIAIAYSGTYVTGHAVYNWYAHGSELSSERMKSLYSEALAEGKARAVAFLPKQKRKMRLPALPAPRRKVRRCPNCQQKLGRRASFCPNCGYNLAPGNEQPPISTLQSLPELE